LASLFLVDQRALPLRDRFARGQKRAEEDLDEKLVVNGRRLFDRLAQPPNWLL
jgi:hypothetical protein